MRNLRSLSPKAPSASERRGLESTQSSSSRSSVFAVFAAALGCFRTGPGTWIAHASPESRISILGSTLMARGENSQDNLLFARCTSNSGNRKCFCWKPFKTRPDTFQKSALPFACTFAFGRLWLPRPRRLRAGLAGLTAFSRSFSFPQTVPSYQGKYLNPFLPVSGSQGNT